MSMSWSETRALAWDVAKDVAGWMFVNGYDYRKGHGDSMTLDPDLCQGGGGSSYVYGKERQQGLDFSDVGFGARASACSSEVESSWPSVNVDGMPMIDGTGLDVCGHVYGQTGTTSMWDD
jgi:hypothetical protein